MEFYFIGNARCLDFVNTEVVAAGVRADLLGSFEDLASWCGEAGILSAGQAREMGREWGGKREAERVLGRARELRAALREMAERLAAGRAVPASALSAINEALRTRESAFEVVRTATGYARRPTSRISEPAQLPAPIAESAAELLCEGDLSLIRKCENPACILYFYDVSKNHARRWCSMSACGNRAKVAAHYHRRRGG